MKDDGFNSIYDIAFNCVNKLVDNIKLVLISFVVYLGMALIHSYILYKVINKIFVDVLSLDSFPKFTESTNDKVFYAKYSEKKESS